MGILARTMLNTSIRKEVIEDYILFIDSRALGMKGASGLVVRAAYKGFKKISPAIMEEAVSGLLDPFMEILDSYYEEYLAAAGPKESFDKWLQPKADGVAQRLLAVTDGVAKNSGHKMLYSLYMPVRKIAEKPVIEAVPGMARVALVHMGAS
jgi:precorrin-2 methylase